MTRIYLIGAGWIAREHVKAALSLFGQPVEIHVADNNPQTVAAFGKEFSTVITHADAAEMLSTPPDDGDIVIVATPPSFHATLACMALETGRHVLCEKPLAVTPEQVTTMFDTARRMGRTLGCCSNRFFGYGPGERVKQLIAEGKIGTPYQVAFVNKKRRNRSGVENLPGSRWFLNRAVSGGGPTMDWSVYDIAMLFDILQPREVVIDSASTFRAFTHADPPPDVIYDVETAVTASLRCKGADDKTMRVNYERASATHGEEVERLEIEGSHGAIRWDWLPWVKEGRLEVVLSTDVEGRVHEERWIFDEKDALSCHYRPLHYFQQHLHGVERHALVDARAQFNIEVILGILSVADNGRPMTICSGL